MVQITLIRLSVLGGGQTGLGNWMMRSECKPLTPGEYAFMRQLLIGQSVESEVLNCQLDSLRYASPFFRTGYFLGIPLRAAKIKRSADRLQFFIGGGYGSEDWQLGDRRRFVINDVVACIDEDNAELIIHYGRLQQLQLMGVMDVPGGALAPYSKVPSSIDPLSFRFCESWNPSSGVGPREFVGERTQDLRDQLGVRYVVRNPSPFQTWFLDLESLSFNSPAKAIPLRVRRARPASGDEIEAFEREHQIIIPPQLHEFWSLTNGASFFGDVICGTYDAQVGDSGRGPEILFLESTSDEGLVVLNSSSPPA
jgi:hypothetical protein